ncbi:hypothetical protein FNV43_RR16998 [Rhamnella rubrinervis]|uniref:EamA domain-containing protein n=1 Tax=Rhamnella rubrinervis TaxID=2594499 RepID=A0A8K0ME46_9ROSA|nr:hypothetical protein FNV43_RR16998 [Rhamnella rubrinervis]
MFLRLARLKAVGAAVQYSHGILSMRVTCCECRGLGGGDWSSHLGAEKASNPDTISCVLKCGNCGFPYMAPNVFKKLVKELHLLKRATWHIGRFCQCNLVTGLRVMGSKIGFRLLALGLKQSSSTFASVTANIVPSITFLLAVVFRMEKLDISELGTQAKIGGTVAAFSGATLMTLYKGITVISTHTQHHHKIATSSKVSSQKDWIKGSVMHVVACFPVSASYILQGIMVCGIAFYVQIVAMKTKAPVFVTAFRPLCTILVAIMGLFITGEALHLVCFIGALLIIVGLYAVLWGKEKEKEKIIVDNTRPQQGFNIICKIALDLGMNQYLLLVYGNAFGTVATALLALTFERKNNSKLSLLVLRDVFFLGLLGSVLGRGLYLAGLKQSSSTFASATANIIPSITFLFAVVLRMEKLDITKLGTQAKIGGTIAAFSGATLMTLYKGITMISMHTQQHHEIVTPSKVSSHKDWIKGSVMIIVSYFLLSAYYILQTKTIKLYPAPITLTSLTCLSGTLLSALLKAIMDHKASSWRLSWNFTLLAPIYSGIMVFGIAFYVQIVAIKTKGPVFVTAFRPLCTVLVAIMGLFITGEALHLGSIIGAMLIIVGLYAILWGKEKEKEKIIVDNIRPEQGV